ncbi:VP5 [Tibet orbivirus]|nr:VP5 [Tibet orbivirus]
MGKIIKSLSKFGKKVSSALTSNTAQKIYKTIGKAAKRFAESEIGSAAIDGVIQGSVQSILTGESYGETVKQAVLLNILGSGDEIPDPISPGEVGMQKKIRELEDDRKYDQIRIKHNEKLVNIYGEDLKMVHEYLTKEQVVEEAEESQINVLEAALRVQDKIITKEEEGLMMLERALIKEAAERSDNETKMVSEYRSKIEALKGAIEIEKEGMQEEAIQEIAGMTADVLEAAAEEVPIAGAGMAAAIASARAVEGAYKLKEVIHALSGIDLSHLRTPKVQPTTLRAIMGSDLVTDRQLAIGVGAKLTGVRENGREVKHIVEEVLPKFKEVLEDDLEEIGAADKKKIPIQTAMKFRIPFTQQPMLHIYAAPWDSDDVFMFHVISHHHKNESFFLGFDLGLEFVYYEDLSMHWHILGGRAQEGVGRTFREAYSEFLLLASRSEHSSAIHQKRLTRSARVHPIFLGNQHYDISYEELKMHALVLVNDENLQQHVLRGPIHFQRRAILGALLRGVEVIDSKIDLALFLRNA